jgi:hypothetical protein
VRFAGACQIVTHQAVRSKQHCTIMTLTATNSNEGNRYGLARVMTDGSMVFSDNYKPKNIMLTGGAGFIGSHVAILLAQKYPAYKVRSSVCPVVVDIGGDRCAPVGSSNIAFQRWSTYLLMRAMKHWTWFCSNHIILAC